MKKTEANEKKSNTICPIPWVFQAIRNNGDVRLCCQANITKNRGVVRKSDGTSYNAGRDDLYEAWQSDFMKDVRKTMLRGEWPDECARCRIEEENGVTSRRENENDMWNWDTEQAAASTNSEGMSSSLPVYYDLRFGNFCNLSCRMCGPTDSHQWYKEWTDYYKIDSFLDTQGEVKLKKDKKGRLFTTDYDWHSNDSFWEQIEAEIPYMRHVYMAGGEPLLIERHYEFLKKCVDVDAARNIILEYNTNLTTLPDRVLKEYWPEFKQVRIGASIDGMGAVQEYQRYPSKWSAIHKNLERMNDLCRENKNITSWLAVTITAYNLFHLPEFMWWKLHSGLDHINTSEKKKIITPHIQHGPQRTSIQVFPDNIKKRAVEHYSMWKEKFRNSEFSEDVKDQAIKILESTESYMMADSKTDKYLDEFIGFTRFLDKSRGQSIVDAIPELGDIFER